MNESPFRQRLTAPIAIIIGAIIISGSIILTSSGGIANIFRAGTPQGGGNPTPVPTITDPASLLTPDNAVIGEPNAKVTIVEFSDFQCPFCRSFWNDTFSQLKKEYIDTGKVRFMYRYFPLTSIHPAAVPSALAAQCAQAQGKFWQFHDAIYAAQEKQGTGTISYTAADIKRWVSGIGLDTAAFNSCLDSAKYQSIVDRDTAAGNAVGVSGTPSFFINGTLVVGAEPYATFKQIIDAQLK